MESSMIVSDSDRLIKMIADTVELKKSDADRDWLITSLEIAINSSMNDICFAKSSDFSKVVAKQYADSEVEFVYDRALDGIFFGMYGYHTIIASALYEARVKGEYTGGADSSDAYIDEGMGFIKSTQSKSILVGDDISLTAREKILFRDFSIKRI